MNKRQLIPIALVFMTVLSVYYMFDSKFQTAAKYDAAVAEGDRQVESGVMVKALESYEKAIALSPSPELLKKVAEGYLKNDDYYSAKRWYERRMVTKYPKESSTYDFGIHMYIEHGDYENAFQAYDTAVKRNALSNQGEQLINQIQYVNELVGSYKEVKSFGNDHIAAVLDYDDKWIFIDTSGMNAFSGKFDKTDNCVQEKAAVVKDGQAMYIDINGDPVITDGYIMEKNSDIDTISEFRDIQSNLILAKVDDVWNYYDATTYEKQHGGYFDATLATLGICGVARGMTSWAIADSKGNLITDYIYESVVVDERGILARNECYFAQNSLMYYLYDLTGKEIAGPYDEARAFNDNTYAAVKKNDRWIFVDAQGHEKDLGNFENAKSFSNGLAPVQIDGNWGYIDMNGNVVIDCQFVDANMITGYGVGFVKINTMWKILKLISKNH